MPQDKVSEYQIPTSAIKNEAPVDEMRQDVYQAYASKNQTPEITNHHKIEVSPNQITQKIISFGEDINKARNEKIAAMPVNAMHHINNMRRFFRSVSGLMFSREMPTLTNKEIAWNELVSKESVIGASLFGLASSRENRYEFFYEGRDEKNGRTADNWFYHEDKLLSADGDRESRTLHYEILDDGVFLVGSGYLAGDELKKFAHITEVYRDKVMNRIYNNKNSSSEKTSAMSSKTVKKIIDFVDKSGLGGSNFAA